MAFSQYEGKIFLPINLLFHQETKNRSAFLEIAFLFLAEFPRAEMNPHCEGTPQKSEHLSQIWRTEITGGWKDMS
jgi:hypothetical protein